MKKLLIILMLLCLIGCKDEIKYPYKINSRNVDMSSYEDLSAYDHNFKAITVLELFNCIDNKSSGVFYLGRSNCGCCQTTVYYLNEVAKEYGVTIYYIDVYDEVLPLTDEDLCEQLKEYLIDILDKNEEGEKELQTPTVFNVINGNIEDSLICLANLSWDDIPNEKQILELKKQYSKIIKPFVD